MTLISVVTPVGAAAVDLQPVAGADRVLIIGHGAGGSIDSPDLVSIRDACRAAGISVARVTQPYRVAGRKAPPAAPILDQAWSAVIASLARRAALRNQAFVYAGRSSGARVACRTAADPALRPPASAVVAIAFPLHPPGRPEKTRLPELAGVPVPVLVVQGAQDPFGMPPDGPGRTIEVVPGDHSLKRSAAAVGPIVAGWLAGLDLSGG
jgi:predicted alpha/beta-hydrolase family hydrolase